MIIKTHEESSNRVIVDNPISNDLGGGYDVKLENIVMNIEKQVCLVLKYFEKI
jgi:hypothetical protein